MIRHTLKEYCETTESHGWKNIVSPGRNRARRWFWLVACLACTGFLVYFTSVRISGYFQYQVQTQFEQQLASDVRMPTVTICNKNEVSLSKFTLEHTRRFLSGRVDVQSLQGSAKRAGVSKTMELIQKLSEDELAEAVSPDEEDGSANDSTLFDYSTYIRDFGYNFSEIVKSCAFNGRRCNKHDGLTFTAPWVFPYGRCMSLNSEGEGSLKVKRPGGGFLLHVTLDKDNFNILRVRDYFKHHGYDVVSSLLANIRPGLLIQVHDPEMSADFISGRSIPIYGGERVDVKIDKVVEVHRLKPPYQDCDDTNRDFTECLRVCADMVLTSEEGGCLFYDTQLVLPECQTLPYPPNGTLEKLQRAFSVCSEPTGYSCAPACEELSYQYEVVRDVTDHGENDMRCKEGIFSDYYFFDSVEAITGDASNVSGSNGSEGTTGTICEHQEGDRDDDAVVSIKFSRLLIETIRYKPQFELGSLAAEIGGMMGLFIGMSLLTLVHVAELLLVSCVNGCGCGKQ